MNPANLLLDNETGQIDMAMVAAAADLRAAREFGSPNYPPSYLREATQYMLDRAAAMQVGWKRDRGIDPWAGVEMVKMSIPTWGASGDGFGR